MTAIVAAMATTPDEILTFWFGHDSDEAATLAAGMPRWFGGGAALDREIAERFAPAVAAARRDQLTHWSDSATGRLVLPVSTFSAGSRTSLMHRHGVRTTRSAPLLGAHGERWR